MRQMRARFLLIVPISMCLFAGNDGADAQDAPGVQALPPVVVTGTKTGVKRGRDQNAVRTARTPTRLVVYPTTPISGAGIDPQKVGQIAADMRSLRKPDPYKNKGVRYTGEKLKKKAGKSGSK